MSIEYPTFEIMVSLELHDADARCSPRPPFRRCS